MFETTYTLTPEQVDEKGNAKLSTLLYFAQEAAGEHCKLLGADRDALQEKQLFWAVIRTSVEITRLPRLGEQVQVKTWPMPTTRVAYPRCVMLYDEQGQPLATVLSLWVLMHTQTRTMVLPGRSGVTVEGFLTGNEPAQPVSLTPAQADKVCQRQVTGTLLDINGHMNNTRYMDWVQELAGEKAVHSFTVNYLSECLEGQSLTLRYVQQEDIFRVDIYRAEGDKDTRVFAAQLAFS